jgi:lipopolysaccharide/colanic/teichoic acid biosynthesis glycosyltransferase
VILKRILDVFASLLALLLMAPIFLLIAIWIKIDSAGPVFFRQTRVGRRGKLFRIHKFRTMRIDAESLGPQITVNHDPRITGCGQFLRRSKLDELPQMLDVLCGSMSMVGPRPEVPKYVALYPDSLKAVVLSLRPGITDYAALVYRRESELLAESTDPEETYIEEILPAKLKYYCEYVCKRNLWMDLSIIFRTFTAVCAMTSRRSQKTV